MAGRLAEGERMTAFEWDVDQVKAVIRKVEEITGTGWFSFGVDLGNGVRYLSDQRNITYDDRTGGAACAISFIEGVIEGARLDADLVPGPMRAAARLMRRGEQEAGVRLTRAQWEGIEEVAAHVSHAYRDGVNDGKAIKADG